MIFGLAIGFCLGLVVGLVSKPMQSEDPAKARKQGNRWSSK